MDTAREKLLHNRLAQRTVCLTHTSLPKAEEQEIVDFMLDKLEQVARNSCECVQRLQTPSSQSDPLKTMAEVTCMRRA